MDGELLLKAASAFVFVVGLMFLFSWFLKRIGLSQRGILTSTEKRLKIVEHLALDHRRRLVLVRRDDQEHLLIMGSNGETVIETNIDAPNDNKRVELAQAKGQQNA